MRLLLLLVFVHQILARSEPVQLTSSNFFRCVNPFGLSLLKKLDYAKENVVFSTLSIAMAVGMLLEGAQKEDKEKLFQLLHCDNYGNRDAIHQQFKAILDEYKKMTTRSENPRNTTVELANLAMIQEGFTLPATFVNALKRDYEAAVKNENFATNGQQVVDKINNIVKERTHGLIPQLFDQPLDPNTVMVLINTIFFKGYWEKFFDSRLTHNATFYNADKSEKTVKMMKSLHTYIKVFHSDKHKASFVELPYLGNMSMFLVVPDKRYGLPNVIQSWEPNDMAIILPQMKLTDVNIYLPKFEFDHTIDLKAVFNKLGVNIEKVLQPVHSSLEISEAVHKAKICTHESGTEAAAVTAFVVSRLSAKDSQPKEIKADHPFLFLILDTKSKVNLFSGVVNQYD